MHSQDISIYLSLYSDSPSVEIQCLVHYEYFKGCSATAVDPPECPSIEVLSVEEYTKFNPFIMKKISSDFFKIAGGSFLDSIENQILMNHED